MNPAEQALKEFYSWKDKLHFEARTITDEEIRVVTETLIEETPIENWTGRASEKYHPQDERGWCGNLIHALRVVKIGRLLIQCVEHSRNQEEICVAGCILHDSFRYGLTGRSEWSVKDHAGVAATALELMNTEASKAIAEVVKTHMGQFWKGDPYFPKLEDAGAINLFIVQADFIASQQFVIVEV